MIALTENSYIATEPVETETTDPRPGKRKKGNAAPKKDEIKETTMDLTEGVDNENEVSADLNQDKIHREELLKPLPDHLDFKVTINQPQQFKMKCGIIANYFVDSSFEVLDGPRFKGISVDMPDSGGSYVICSRLSCHTQTSQAKQQDPHFFINIKYLNLCLQLVENNYCLEISRAKNTAEIDFRAYDLNNEMEPIQFTLFSLDHIKPLETLQNMEHRVAVDITEINRFKQFIKIAEKVNAEDIQFTIYEPKRRKRPANQAAVPEQKQVFLQMMIMNCAIKQMSKMFHSVTEWTASKDKFEIKVQQENEVKVDEVDLENLEMVLQKTFSIALISKFIRPMERSSLRMLLDPFYPLIMQYALGDEDSYIKLALGPKNSSDTDTNNAAQTV